MPNYLNQLVDNNQLADACVGLFITAWFWPYYVMGNLDAWQKLGITMNGIRPICKE